MAAIACDRKLAAAAFLSALGISVAINESVWAGVITLFVLPTTGVVTMGTRKHYSPKPQVVAATGAGILVYTMNVHYHFISKLIGIAFLGFATYLDYDMRSCIT